MADKYQSKHTGSQIDQAVATALKNKDIKTAAVSDNKLVFTFTDGTSLTVDGVVGEKGEKGDKGDTGAAGPAGKDGKTPVKGTDYWTDSDKQEIVESVIADLPLWDGTIT